MVLPLVINFKGIMVCLTIILKNIFNLKSESVFEKKLSVRQNFKNIFKILKNHLYFFLINT